METSYIINDCGKAEELNCFSVTIKNYVYLTISYLLRNKINLTILIYYKGVHSLTYHILLMLYARDECSISVRRGFINRGVNKFEKFAY